MYKKPSALFPIAMSLLALCVVLTHVAIFGAAPDADEGAAAHLFQFLIAAQIPPIGIFLVRWLPKEPRRGLQVLAAQIGALFLALAPVYFLHL